MPSFGTTRLYFLRRNNYVMTEFLLNEHFSGQFWRIHLQQKHSETVAGTI